LTSNFLWKKYTANKLSILSTVSIALTITS
jgi:hypothetical protein